MLKESLETIVPFRPSREMIVNSVSTFFAVYFNRHLTKKRCFADCPIECLCNRKFSARISQVKFFQRKQALSLECNQQKIELTYFLDGLTGKSTSRHEKQ